MNAIVWACSDSRSEEQAINGLDPLFWPLFDTPFIQHVVERLVRLRIERLDVLVDGNAHRLETLLGDGTKWGCEIEYHPIRSGDSPYTRLVSMLTGSQPVLLVDAGNLCEVAAEQIENARASTYATAFVFPNELNKRLQWSGWAVVNGPQLADWNPEDRASFERGLLHQCNKGGRLSIIPRPLAAREPQDLLQLHRECMDFDSSHVLVQGRTVSSGVRLCGRSAVPSEVEIVPPVFIGRQTRFGAGSRIGPFAVIGSGSVLAANSSVVDAIVLPRTYVGEEIHLRDSVAGRNRLWNARLQSSVAFEDSSLLRSVPHFSLSPSLMYAASRLFAALMLIANLLPSACLLLVALLRGKVNLSRSTVAYFEGRVDAKAQPLHLATIDFTPSHKPWTPVLAHYLSVLMPGLLSALAGKCSVVGPRMRTFEELEVTPHWWRQALAESRGGLLSPAFAIEGHGTAADIFLCESFHSLMWSLRKQVGVLAAYYKQLACEAFDWLF